MGTSKGYGMPTGGPWTPVKRDFTRFAKQGPTPTLTPQGLLSGFLGASGGADRISRGSGQGGQGGRGGGGGGGGGGEGGSIGRAARSAGQNLGGFLSSVVTVGLDEALRDVGLGDLVGRQAREVTAGLVEVLVGPASTLDDDAARDAFIDLNDELMRETATYAEVKKIFSTVLDETGISRLLVRFFSRYIFHLVRRNFYEKLLKQESRDKAGHTLKSIRDCIKSKLEAKLGNRNLLHIKWKGAEGRRITETIFRDTIRIYEAPA